MELHFSTGSISHDAETAEDYFLPLGGGSGYSPICLIIPLQALPYIITQAREFSLLMAHF